MFLQQDKPQDFVIAMGLQYSIREFITWTATALGIQLKFEGHGVNEVAIVSSLSGYKAPVLNVDQIIVKVDPKYFRLTEVENLLGDPGKAKTDLDWIPEITAQEFCAEMVERDLKQAKRNALLKSHGYPIDRGKLNLCKLGICYCVCGKYVFFDNFEIWRLILIKYTFFNTASMIHTLKLL